MSCLAKHSDDLWHLAEIQSIDQNHICVQYRKFNFVSALEWESVLLLDNPSDDLSDEEIDIRNWNDLDEDLSDSTSSDDQEIAPKNAPNTSKNFETQFVSLGTWEKHTKGFGSRLMAKMGYVSGKGLGKGGEGRIEPVEIIVLPEGNFRSILDKVKSFSIVLLEKRTYIIGQGNGVKGKESA